MGQKSEPIRLISAVLMIHYLEVFCQSKGFIDDIEGVY